VANQLITIVVSAKTGQAQAEFAAVGRSVGASARQMDAAAKVAQARMAAFGAAASTFGKIVTLGVAGGLALSAKAAIDFESSFTGVRKTLNATEGQFLSLADGIRQLSKEIPINVNELNRIAELGGQLDISIGGIETFTETIAKIGVATELSTEAAALGFSRLGNVLGVAENDFDRMGAALVDLGNNSATTEDQILTFALRIAPVGKTVGLTADQVLALAAAFSTVGIPAERGGTAVQRAFIEMTKAIDYGGAELESFAKIAGTTTSEFATIFKRDAAQAFNLFIEGVGRVAREGGNVSSMLEEVGLGAARTFSTITALANNTGGLTRALNLSSKAWQENLALNAEADKRFATTSSQVTLAKNQMNDLGIEIGQSVIPQLGALANILGNVGAGFQAIDGPTRVAIKGFAALTIGITIASLAGKGAVKLFGVFLPAAMKETGIQAVMLRSAMGAGLTAGIFLAISAFQRWGAQQKRNQTITEDLTTAIKEQKSSLEDLASPAVVQSLDDAERALLSFFEISPKVFGEAITGNTVALGLLTDQYDKLKDRTGNSIVDSTQQVALMQLLTSRTNLYKTAVEQARIQLEQESKLQANDTEIMRMRMRALGSMTDAISEMGDAASLSEDQINALADAMNGLDDAVSTSLDFVDAVRSLAEAQADLNDTTDPSIDQFVAYQRALNNVEQAARELGPNGIQPAIDQINMMRQMGLLTENQYIEFYNILLQIQPIAQSFGSGAAIISGNLDMIGSVAANAGVPIGAFINLLLGMNAAMLGTIQNASQLSLALDLAINKPGKLKVLNLIGEEDAASQLDGVALDAVNAIARRFKRLSGDFVNIGKEVAKAMGVGIRGGGGGGGGGGGSSDGGAVGAAVEDVLGKAMDTIREQLDAFTGAISATQRFRRAIRDLADAEKGLLDLRREQKTLPDQILAAEERLRRARSRAVDVTLDEQLAIQVAEENLARAQLAFAQGRITQTELSIAERDLANTRIAATADTDEVRQAENDLTTLRDRQIGIVSDLSDANSSLLDAQLGLVDAQVELVRSGKDFNDIGKDGVDIFRDLAQQVGLTKDAIQSLIDLGFFASDAFTADQNTTGGLIPLSDAGGGSTTGSGTSASNVYTVKAGDTLSAVSAFLGVTLGKLLALNATVTNSITGISRTLDPNLIFAGDLLQFALGGVVPGMVGQPQLIMAHGGERITSSSTSRKQHNADSGGGVTIQNLNVRGVFDPTRPQEWQKIMVAVRTELEYDRRSRTVGMG